MEVMQLYTYPIKSLRPHSLREAQLTRHGFRYDRKFMLLRLLRDKDDESISFDNMHVSHYHEMVLFRTEIRLPTSPCARDGDIVVTYELPGKTTSSINIPLEPIVDSLQIIDVEMHKSATEAYNMGTKYNDWFSAQFGFEVVLAYLGDHHRQVLMSTTHNADNRLDPGWISSMKDAAASLFSEPTAGSEKAITFADCAPYLVVSHRSMDDVHNRLPDGQLMDISKFRPNIVVSGANQPWDEDYWGEIMINGTTKIECIHNCARCVSINVDYNTGKIGTKESGKILARLQKDRRIDAGAKYSPVFGRYSFVHQNSEGDVIRVGDEVLVTKVNPNKTKFDWDGLCT